MTGTDVSSTLETSLPTKKLGNSDLELTPIGFGAWAIGGGSWEFGWGAQEDSESIEAIHQALDEGLNWIDTAPVYGLGHSEEVVAKAVKSSGKKPLIFTKCSMRWDQKRQIYRSLKAASIVEELEQSLKRLNLETIDLYQVHWPNPEDEIEEGWAELAKQQQAGKIRYLGVSNFNVEQMKRVQAIAPITSLQPPYSMLRPAVEAEILPYCQQNGIGVINYSPMVSGLLTGRMSAERVAEMPADDWRKKAVEFNEPRLNRNLKLVEVLREIGSAHGVQPGVVAVAWTLHHPAITAAIVGGRSREQLKGLAPAMYFRLTAEEYGTIQKFITENPV